MSCILLVVIIPVYCTTPFNYVASDWSLFPQYTIAFSLSALKWRSLFTRRCITMVISKIHSPLMGQVVRNLPPPCTLQNQNMYFHAQNTHYKCCYMTSILLSSAIREHKGYSNVLNMYSPYARLNDKV